MKLGDIKKLGLNEEQTAALQALMEKDTEALNSLKEELAGTKQQLIEANGAIEGFKGLDVDALNAQISDYKLKAEEAATQAEQRIAEMEKLHALDRALSEAKAYDPVAVRPYLDTAGLTLKDGKLVGLDAQLETVRKEKSFLFEPPKSGGLNLSAGEPPGDWGMSGNEKVNAGIREQIRRSRV